MGSYGSNLFQPSKGTTSLAASLLSTLRDGYGWVVHWSGSNATTFIGKFLKILMKLSSRSLETISKIIRTTPSYYRTGTSIYQWTWRLSSTFTARSTRDTGYLRVSHSQPNLRMSSRSISAVCFLTIQFAHMENHWIFGIYLWFQLRVCTVSYSNLYFRKYQYRSKEGGGIEIEIIKNNIWGYILLSNTHMLKYSILWLPTELVSFCAVVSFCADLNMHPDPGMSWSRSGCLAAFFYSGVDHTIWV